MMNFIHRISFGFEFGNLVPSDTKILNLKRQSVNLTFKLHHSFKFLLDKLVPTLARQALRFLCRDPEINWIFYLSVFLQSFGVRFLPFNRRICRRWNRRVPSSIPIKGYGLDPIFALRPPCRLPRLLFRSIWLLVRALQGDPENSGNFQAFCSKILGILGITRI